GGPAGGPGADAWSMADRATAPPGVSALPLSPLPGAAIPCAPGWRQTQVASYLASYAPADSGGELPQLSSDTGRGASTCRAGRCPLADRWRRQQSPSGVYAGRATPC